MRLRVRVRRMKPCLSHPQRRIIHLFHSYNSQRGSASASPRVRAKGAMRRVQMKLQGLRVQFPTLWHQVQGLMRNTHCLQTLRSALRRKGRAIVAVVVKSGKSFFFCLTAISCGFTPSCVPMAILTLSSLSDLGLHLLADPSFHQIDATF